MHDAMQSISHAKLRGLCLSPSTRGSNAVLLLAGASPAIEGTNTVGNAADIPFTKVVLVQTEAATMMAVAALAGIVGISYMYKAAGLHVALATWRQQATRETISPGPSVASTAPQHILEVLLSELRSVNIWIHQNWSKLVHVGSWVLGGARFLRPLSSVSKRK